MPLYEYRCPKCSHTFEKIVKISDPNPPCPNIQVVAVEEGWTEQRCDHETEKLISRTSFALKGGGWYSDGYGK